MQGTMFFGKQLRLNFSLRQSDVINKLRGHYDESGRNQREKNRVEALRDLETKKKRKMITRALMLREQVRKGPVFGLGGPPMGYINEFEGPPVTEMPRLNVGPGMGYPPSGRDGMPTEMHHILFVDNLPTSIEPAALQ